MMRWGFWVFSVSFVASVAWSGAGCSAMSGDCNCQATPHHPGAQDPIPGLEVASYDNQGNDTPSPVTPSEGSIEVTPDEVVIRYQQDNVEHEVRYTVSGPL